MGTSGEMHALILSDQTMVRLQGILERTGNETFAGVKAMMIEQMIEKMRNGICHFVFVKKDNQLREAWGTLNPSLIRSKVNGRGISREKYGTTAFYDVENGGWRSLRWESIVKVF